MIAQAKYMFQRNPNERGPNGPQRPNGGGNGANGGGPPRGRSTSSLIVRTVLIVAVVLLGWTLNTSWLTVPDVTLNAALVAGLSPLAAPVSV